MSRAAVLAAVVSMVFAGCGGDDDSIQDEALSSVAPTTTTTLATTTTAVTTTTTRPPSIETEWMVGEWEGFHPSYQSVGFSCGDDGAGCSGNTDMSLTEMWIGYDDPDRAIDFIDFFMRFQPEADSTDPSLEYLGLVDDPGFADSGHGIRVVQLERPPLGTPGVNSGQAWIELTVSSVSADEFASRPPSPAISAGFAKYHGPTTVEPIAVTPNPEATHLIDDVVLVRSTGDMMRWIIVLRYPGTYLYQAGYWGRGSGAHNALNFQIRRA